jgi:hypothetical protein
MAGRDHTAVRKVERALLVKKKEGEKKERLQQNLPLIFPSGMVHKRRTGDR